MIYYPIVVILFVLNFLVDAEPKFSEYPTVIVYIDYIYTYTENMYTWVHNVKYVYT